MAEDNSSRANKAIVRDISGPKLVRSRECWRWKGHVSPSRMGDRIQEREDSEGLEVAF